MPDEPHFTDDNTPQPPPEPEKEGEIPASVAFMEIMRRAAARHEATRPPPPPAAPSAVAPGTQRPTAAPVVAQTVVNPRRDYDDAMEAQRVQRVKKRQSRRRRQTVGVIGGIFRSVTVILIAGALMATIFTWSTPTQFINDQVKSSLSIAQATGASTTVPTIIPTPNWLRRVGIVSGHRGPQVPPDPGAVCPDGLTEASINFAVAQQVVRNLRDRGYSVDLLDEFDSRLEDYQAAALVSIHSNTCQNFGEVVSGYLIARAAARSGLGQDDNLVECVARYYGQATALTRRQGVTIDMTDYHTFREIHPLTPAAILELGFMLADRDILTDKQTEMAKGITDGILCFLEPNSQALPTLDVTPTPTG
ncbi:MAG: N-acetylmuramoyl-L-alanine amidase [Chloroflexi bacterium]|nr:N-acetylmuramoyl-L-alanine amidase [Chloroflexota bacterium]MCC6893730.1 N-acetylmuramoyl-L-alanine amidase [Anaerolineae bacterium]